MKKIFALLLVVATLFTLVACTKDQTEIDEPVNDQLEATEAPEDATPEVTDEPVSEDDNKVDDNKVDDKKPEAKPTDKPVITPAPTPTAEPTPEAPKTIGQALLADFNAKASSTDDILALAESIMTNPVIEFSAGAMPVEPGLLSGFDNAEITGFKQGVTFGPIIGSIPFIGYIFELENGTDVSGFIANLKANANLRWNICVEADEMLTGNVSNKVFFLMSPKDMSEE